MRRTIFLSSKRCLYSSLTSAIHVSPLTSFSKLPSSKTLSPPGSPREIPVITYGSSFRSSIFTALDLVPVPGAEVIQRVMSAGVFATVMSQSGSVLQRAWTDVTTA